MRAFSRRGVAGRLETPGKTFERGAVDPVASRDYPVIIILMLNQEATLLDVARRAGVSIKTVSRVVNREPHVRNSTRARVQQAIDELNYQPNVWARNLASRRIAGRAWIGSR